MALTFEIPWLISIIPVFLLLLHFILTVVVGAKISDYEKDRLKEYVSNYWKYQTNSVNQRYVDDIQVKFILLLYFPLLLEHNSSFVKFFT